MSDKLALEIINKIFKSIFNRDNDQSLDEILEKFAFDVKLPKEVKDSTTNETTYAISINSGRFITNDNMMKKDIESGWMLPKKDINDLKELIDIWNSINLTTTERVYDSVNILKSDTIYSSENIYRSCDIRDSKNVIFSDSLGGCEYALASSRSGNCNYVIRCDDSGNCSNSYNVICSSKITNSFFIQDCSNLNECMFCSHISNKEYVIANMQFTKEEYFEIKESIIDWIINE